MGLYLLNTLSREHPDQCKAQPATFHRGATVKLRKPNKKKKRKRKKREKEARSLIDPTQIGRIPRNVFERFKELEVTCSLINDSPCKYGQTNA